MHFTKFQEFCSPLLYCEQTPRRGTLGNTIKRRAEKANSTKAKVIQYGKFVIYILAWNETEYIRI